MHELTEARIRAYAKVLFFVHLGIFIVMNAVMIAINLNTSDYLWFKWPLMGWGIGLVAHSLLTLAILRGHGLHQWLIDRELRRNAMRKT